MDDAVRRLQEVRERIQGVIPPGDGQIEVYFDLAMSRHEFGQLARVRVLDKLRELKPHIAEKLAKKYDIRLTPRMRN